MGLMVAGGYRWHVAGGDLGLLSSILWKNDWQYNDFTRNYYLAKDKEHKYLEEVDAKKQLKTWRNFVENRLEEE